MLDSYVHGMENYKFVTVRCLAFLPYVPGVRVFLLMECSCDRRFWMCLM
jgi:hypothetical protein